MFQKITEDPIKKCPACGQDSLQRGPGGGIGVSFKGSGFYATDYAQPTTPPPSNEKSGGGCCPCGKNKPSCSSGNS